MALVSFAYWQQRFAGSPEILARRIEIGGRSHAVIGVLPPGTGRRPTRWVASFVSTGSGVSVRSSE